MTRRAWAAVPVGAVVGLTWAAGLRVWMAQLVGEGSTVGWLTLVLVLLPGAVVGGLLGWAAGRQAEVVGSTAHRWSAGRVIPLAVGALGTMVVTALGTMAGPVTTARGAWVCLLGGSLVVVLGVASTLVLRPGMAWGDGALPWAGAVAGLAWAGSLRGFMAEVVGDGSAVSWIGTFGWVLLPGTLAGALLGWAEAERHRGRPHRVLVWSPLLFVAVLLPGLADLGGMLEDGVGGGAVGVPLALVVGAYAVAGPRGWVRAVCGVTFAAVLVVWVLVAPAVGGAEFALDHPHGIWASTLFIGLLLSGAVAAATTLRGAPRPAGRGPSAGPLLVADVQAGRARAATRSGSPGSWHRSIGDRLLTKP